MHGSDGGESAQHEIGMWFTEVGYRQRARGLTFVWGGLNGRETERKYDHSRTEKQTMIFRGANSRGGANADSLTTCMFWVGLGFGWARPMFACSA